MPLQLKGFDTHLDIRLHYTTNGRPSINFAQMPWFCTQTRVGDVHTGGIDWLCSGDHSIWAHVAHGQRSLTPVLGRVDDAWGLPLCNFPPPSQITLHTFVTEPVTLKSLWTFFMSSVASCWQHSYTATTMLLRSAENTALTSYYLLAMPHGPCDYTKWWFVAGAGPLVCDNHFSYTLLTYGQLITPFKTTTAPTGKITSARSPM